MSENTLTDADVDAGSSRLRLSHILTIPNQLTLLRMAILPFILISMIYGHHTASLWLFAAAALTDAIDGIVARRFNQKTQLGQYLDPIADKLLMSSCFVAQSVIGTIPWWVTILVLLRDVVIIATALVVVLSTDMRSFPPSFLGKATTSVQALALTAVLLNNVASAGWSDDVITVLIMLTAMATVLSALHYGMEITRRLYADQSSGGTE